MKTLMQRRPLDFRSFFCAAATAVILLLTGCGGGGGGSNNPPPAAPPPPAAQTFTWEFGKDSIDFGKVVAGQTVRSALTIENTGTGSLTITFSDPGNGFALEGSCSTLAAGAECTRFITFSRSDVGNSSATLNVTSAAPAKSIGLTAQAVGLDVEITQVANSCLNPIIGRVVVSDAAGGPVTGLLQNNFSALLSGANATFSSLTPINNRSEIAVGLVIDNSGSLTNFQADVRDASRIFVNSLTRNDRAGIFKFSAEIDRNFQDFVTADATGKETLRVALNKDFDGGATGQAGSNIWGATNFVIEKLKLETKKQRLAILISDGKNTINSTPLTDLINSAAKENIQVYVVAYGELELDGLQQLATGTGGQLFISPDTSDLSGTYDKVTSLLSNQYEFSIVNPSPGPAKTLRMTVNTGSAEGEDIKDVLACP